MCRFFNPLHVRPAKTKVETLEVQVQPLLSNLHFTRTTFCLEPIKAWKCHTCCLSTARVETHSFRGLWFSPTVQTKQRHSKQNLAVQQFKKYWRQSSLSNQIVPSVLVILNSDILTCTWKHQSKRYQTQLNAQKRMQRHVDRHKRWTSLSVHTTNECTKNWQTQSLQLQSLAQHGKHKTSELWVPNKPRQSTENCWCVLGSLYNNAVSKQIQNWNNWWANFNAVAEQNAHNTKLFHKQTATSNDQHCTKLGTKHPDKTNLRVTVSSANQTRLEQTEGWYTLRNQQFHKSYDICFKQSFHKPLQTSENLRIRHQMVEVETKTVDTNTRCTQYSNKRKNQLENAKFSCSKIWSTTEMSQMICNLIQKLRFQLLR